MSIVKVKEYLKNFGREEDVLEFSVSSATVELAAKAAGVEPARIAKTLSFHGDEKNGCILIVTAGDCKIDNSKYKKQFGFKAKMLGAEEVSVLTGHDIGGVCPFANPEHVTAYLDESLKRFTTVFPAAGSASSAIELTCDELMEYSGAKAWIDVCKTVEPPLIRLGYGEDQIAINTAEARSVTFLSGRELPVIEDVKAAFLRAVTEDVIGCPPLGELISSEDDVTIIVSDVTRHWSRQDLVCRELVTYLHEELRLPYEQMVILVALGTHRGHTEEEQKKIVSPEVYDHVRVINHDAYADDLCYLGTTSRGTRVCVNPLAVNRKVILTGATVHHLMAGFGGGRKSILPGISGLETVTANHLHCLDPDSPHSNPAIGCGILKGNPVHEDMMEAAAMVHPVFGINIIAGYNGRQNCLLCGDWEKSWLKSCEIVNEAFGVPIKEEADIVIASCGGYPKDINLYQGIKTLLNMSYAVRQGGTMIFLAECGEGGGAGDFFDWRLPLKAGRLDQELRKHFTIAGYIFYAGCESISKGQVHMLTSFSGDLTREVLEDMNIHGYSSVSQLLEAIDFRGKSVYVMPYGGNTVPYLLKS